MCVEINGRKKIQRRRRRRRGRRQKNREHQRPNMWTQEEGSHLNTGKRTFIGNQVRPHLYFYLLHIRMARNQNRLVKILWLLYFIYSHDHQDRQKYFYKCSVLKNLRIEEMFQRIKYLPYKHENIVGIPTITLKTGHGNSCL